MANNRKVISTRMKPEVIEKLDCLVNQFNLDTTFWGSNKHTTSLGYCLKKVTKSDALEILINKAFDEMQNIK
jgi:hypothetical protein